MNRANEITESINKNHDYPKMQKRIARLGEIKKGMGHAAFITKYGEELDIMRKVATADKTAPFDLWREIDLLQEIT